MKVTVRIHRPSGLELKTKKLEDDETVILRKTGTKKFDWRPKIRQLEAKHSWFGRTKFYADVYPEAVESWTYEYDLKNPDDRPHWDKKQSKRLLDAKILERAGEEPKEKQGAAIWILAILIVAMGIINILFASGKIRLG